MRTCSKFRANFLTHLAGWCVALPQAEGGPMIDKWFRRCIKFDIFQLQPIYGSCVRDLHLGQPQSGGGTLFLPHSRRVASGKRPRLFGAMRWSIMQRVGAFTPERKLYSSAAQWHLSFSSLEQQLHQAEV